MSRLLRPTTGYVAFYPAPPGTNFGEMPMTGQSTPYAILPNENNGRPLLCMVTGQQQEAVWPSAQQYRHWKTGQWDLRDPDFAISIAAMLAGVIREAGGELHLPGNLLHRATGIPQIEYWFEPGTDAVVLRVRGEAPRAPAAAPTTPR